MEILHFIKFKEDKGGNMESKQDMPLRSQKGFTLIELAIVLVIIGIILGAVLKGQDLIANARAKKVINWEKSWETAQWTYLDRKGNFAGDSDKDGIIGKNETGTTATAIYEIGAANFINPPASNITIGSLTFYMKMGYNASSNKNVIVICKAADCATGFASDELIYMEAIDTTIDGFADPTAGNVRAALSVTLKASSNNETVEAFEEATNQTSWTATTHKGLAYYFDRPH